MRETLEIGSTPCDEDCAQVGADGYSVRARAECNAFREQLRRMFGPEPDGASLCIKSNPHDFGSYLEVAVKFDCDNEAACEYAYKCEGEGPSHWDAEARAALGLTDDQALEA
jgi:hypothetical protein